MSTPTHIELVAHDNELMTRVRAAAVLALEAIYDELPGDGEDDRIVACFQGNLDRLLGAMGWKKPCAQK